jgi:hypothetical protein
MKTARAIGVVGTGLETITSVNIAPIIDPVTAQVVLAIAIPVGGTTVVRGVGLANAVEPRSRATFANGITNFAAITMGVSGTFHTAAVGIAD